MSLDRWTARDCARHVNDREVSALDIARHFIARVDMLNPALNAIVRFDAEAVLADAAAVDRALADGAELPMAGVPVTIKDNLWVGGRTVTQGSRLFADFVAPRDAWAVARLRALGAVVLGITNCSEFACRGVTDNLVHGTTCHPLDNTLTPGGSSGGAASALGAGLGLLAIGTDAGGSVRRPAAHCGLVGLKPTQGVIPHPWGFKEPNHGVSVVGVFARNTVDAAWALDHLGAYDASDVSAPPLSIAWGAEAAAREAPSRALRFAWSPRLGCDFAIDDDVLAVLTQRIDRLRDAGWTIDEADPDWADAVRAHPMDTLQHAGLHALHGDDRTHRPQDISAALTAQIDAGARTTPADRASALRGREAITHHLARFFSHHDVLLCPTAPVTAWPHAQIGPAVIGGRTVGPRAHAAFTPLFNLAGVPACSVPAGLVRGLPVGLQVIAPRFQDARVLQVAALLERNAA